jgi:hypothetical protein
MRKVIEGARDRLCQLPAYSPDLNPIAYGSDNDINVYVFGHDLIGHAACAVWKDA